jgi:hypothetical protein
LNLHIDNVVFYQCTNVNSKYLIFGPILCGSVEHLAMAFVYSHSIAQAYWILATR